MSDSCYVFSKRSLDNLSEVHQDLAKVCYLALSLSKVDFGVICGLRTPGEQSKLVLSGKSRTMKSRHLYGYAVDVMAYPTNKGSWDINYYKDITKAFKEAAKALSIPIVCGIDWKEFVDAGHIELDRKTYPDNSQTLTYSA